jgi:hypothetical protein
LQCLRAGERIESSTRRRHDYVPGGRGPLKLDTALLRIRGLLDRDHLPFIRASSAAVCLSPPTKKAAGQKMTIAAAVATPSFVRCLSCAPDNVAALVEMA